MNIKFDVYFKKNLGTLCKDNEVDLDGKEAYINLDLNLVDRLEANYSVGSTKYTDEVTIKDVKNKEILIPFKSDVVKEGLNEFEIVAYMKNGDVKVSQTYTYSIEEGIGDGKQVSGESNHTHTNLAILNTITQTKVNEWNNKANASHEHSDYASNVHTHNVNEIEGLENIDIDLSNYYTKSETDEVVNSKADKIHTHNEYLTEYQDISHKADKVDTYTKTETDNKISEEIDNKILEGIDNKISEEIDRQIADGTIANMTIEDNSITTEKVAYYKKYNLNILNVNDADCLIDKDYEWKGTIFDSTGGTVYDIPVKPQRTYYFDKASFNPSSYYGILLDEDKKYISHHIMGMHGSNTSVTTPVECKFIRIRVANSKKDVAYLSEKHVNEYNEYNTIECLIDDNYLHEFKMMYENLLSESFAKQSVVDEIINNLNNEIINLKHENSRLSNGINDMYLCAGNIYEEHPVVFKKGYVYKLTSASSWCNQNNIIYDCIDSIKQVNLKGYYNVKVYKDGVQVLPSCDYVNTASLYPVTNHVKNRV